MQVQVVGFSIYNIDETVEVIESTYLKWDLVYHTDVTVDCLWLFFW